VASGGHDDFWYMSWIGDGLYCFDGYSWTSFNSGNGKLPPGIRDVSNITIHPQNKDLIYAGTWGKGVLEMNMNDGKVVVYDSSNSPLQKRCQAPDQGEFVAGIAFDSKGVMWVANSNANNLLVTRDKTGVWASHHLGGEYDCRWEIRNMIIDSYDNKWMVDRLGRLIVYNEKNGGEVRVIGSAAGLEGRAYSIAEDKNQNIWVGTDDGIFVIRSLYNILSNNTINIDRPKLTLGGHVDYLLKGETVIQIVVNGANEKWCLSNKQGIYKITGDGMSEIFHLTDQDCRPISLGNIHPLLSNNMMALCITDNGEVFMATEQGIVSYRDEATKGTSSNSNVYAFPNPVKPDYQGPIAIRGVVDMAEIKITDVAGSLVYSTQAKGGQAIWDARDFNGKRVTTGVYIVFITNEDGTETTVTKIMVLN
jgi:ligand-binding sensor domain-containing protein